MENNFGLILLDLVGKNKDKFLGLLRRNGVLVSTNVSNENLTNMILKAMQKSESFKKETIMLMGVLMAESSDDSFANSNGFKAKSLQELGIELLALQQLLLKKTSKILLLVLFSTNFLF